SSFYVLRATARAEPDRSRWVRPTNFATTPSPVHLRLERILGVTAAGRLTRRRCLTALHLRSVWSRTYDFHQTSPRGPNGAVRRRQRPGAPGQCPCLFGVRFPPSGPWVWILTSCSCGRASRTGRDSLRSRARAEGVTLW